MVKTSNLSNYTVKNNQTLKDVLEKIKLNKKGIVIVIGKSKKVLGVITSADIRDSLLKNKSKQLTAEKIMNKNFVYLKENFKNETFLKLIDQKVKQIPLLNKKGQLIDIVGHDFKLNKEFNIYRSKTPVRISFSGGGSDFSNYFMKYNGSCLTSAISLYSYATLRIRDDSKIIINSLNPNSKLKFKNINEINYNGKLDLVKGVIKILKPEFGFDLEINSDFPLSSGLGGSSSLISSIIGVFNEYSNSKIDKYTIAEISIQIERLELNIKGGWQDQYSTIFGGFNLIEFNSKENLVTPIKLENDNILELQERLVLCYTKSNHLGEKIQKINTKKNLSKSDITNINKIKNITNEMKKYLLLGDFDKFGILLEKSWMLKKSNNKKVSNKYIDKIYNIAKQNGAEGGKLLGTGGGGYFLFYVKPYNKNELITSMKKLNLKIEKFTFDLDGLRSWKTI